MQVVASQNLGPLGRGESVPASIRWHWYYSLPGVLLWVLLLVLSVVPRHNRSLQAWSILIVPLAVASLFSGLMLLFGDSFIPLQAVGQFLFSLACASTAVWLLGPWLKGRTRFRTALRLLAVMVAVGMVAYVEYFGFWIESETAAPVMALWFACVLPLIAATALSSVGCRRAVSAPALLLWPMLWLPLGCIVCVPLCMMIFWWQLDGADLSTLAFVLIQALVTAPFLAGALYLLHLPAAVLCVATPCYRQRFNGWFCEVSTAPEPVHDPLSAVPREANAAEEPAYGPPPDVDFSRLGSSPFAAAQEPETSRK